MSKYKHLFFDLDHTLWDFVTNSQEALVDLYQRHNLESRLKAPVDQFLNAYYQINDELWALYRKSLISKEELRHQRFHRAFHSFGPLEEETILTFEKQYMELAPRKTGLMPGTLKVLAALKPKFQLHIITNGFSDAQKIKLDESGLRPFFGGVFCSDAIGINKPEAGIFIEAMRRVGAERKNSLMIGDNLLADISGARNVGIDQVFYNPKGVAHNDQVTFELRHLEELLPILL